MIYFQPRKSIIMTRTEKYVCFIIRSPKNRDVMANAYHSEYKKALADAKALYHSNAFITRMQILSNHFLKSYSV